VQRIPKHIRSTENFFLKMPINLLHNWQEFILSILSNPRERHNLGRKKIRSSCSKKL
jgi:hypothetical protein